MLARNEDVVIDAGEIAAAPSRKPGRGRLYRKFATLLVALVASAIAVTALFGAYSSYLGNRAAQIAIQREKAQGAATLIEQFLREIEGQLGWATLAGTAAAGDIAARRLDLLRLLRQASAVTEVAYVDGNGIEQLKVSRLAMDSLGGTANRAHEPVVAEALANGRAISPVYFRKESEPYLTMAITGASRRAGVIVAEVNLKFIWDVISRIKLGKGGVAYAVNQQGLLIAHPDIGLVLRKTDFSDLAQVKAALVQPGGAPLSIATDRQGRDVLTAQAMIEPVGWRIFVEQPLELAFAPVYESLERTAVLSLVGMALAALVGLWVARRFLVPIEAVVTASARIGAGDLAHRVTISTGDEVEALAEGLNDMAAKLEASYAGLERLVDERTHELARTVSELRALGEIGQAVTASLDLATVLRTILMNACTLSEADGGAAFGADRLRRTFALEAGFNLPETVMAALHAAPPSPADPLLAAAMAARAPTEVEVAARTPASPFHDLLAAQDVRRMLVVPLLHKEEPIGALTLHRPHDSPFGSATLAILGTFASQSAIALHNARLYQALEAQGEQLRIASLHKSQFLANMSHELRTPLNAILGYTELISDGVYGDIPRRAQDVIGRVQTNGRHLLGLINDVLDLSKIEAGQVTLRLDEYSMSELVRTVLATTETLAAEKDLTLSADHAAILPPARGDAQRLTQVLLNLVGNAIKFTDSGAVRIGVRLRGHKFVITVTDTGPGIPLSEQGKIFEEFHQVDSSNTKKKGGTGLGLAISRRIVALHGGRISVRSEPGAGSEFRIDLPVRVEKQRGIA